MTGANSSALTGTLTDVTDKTVEVLKTAPAKGAPNVEGVVAREAVGASKRDMPGSPRSDAEATAAIEHATATIEARATKCLISSS